MNGSLTRVLLLRCGDYVQQMILIALAGLWAAFFVAFGLAVRALVRRAVRFELDQREAR